MARAGKRIYRGIKAGLGPALLFGGLLGLLGWSSDVGVARAAAALPESALRLLLAFTALGRAGYMLWLTAAVGLGAFVAWQRTGGRQAAVGLALLVQRSVYVFVVLALSGLVTQIVKHAVGRSRPKLLDAFGAFHFEPLSWQSALASFPSGHTTTAFAAATALTAFMPRGRFFLYAFAFAIGLSRIAVGAHYPTDVLGGIVVGIAHARVIGRGFAHYGIAFEQAGERNLRPRGRGVVMRALRRRLERRQSFKATTPRK